MIEPVVVIGIIAALTSVTFLAVSTVSDQGDQGALSVETETHAMWVGEMAGMARTRLAPGLRPAEPT